MRRSSRITASRVVEPIITCDKYYTAYEPTTAECAEFIYLTEYFKMGQYLNPADLSFETLYYFCKKLYRVFYRILNLYENETVYELSQRMQFYNLYKKPFTTKNVFNAVKTLVGMLPHDDYVNEAYCNKFTFETTEQYYNRMRMKSNIEDRDNYTKERQIDDKSLALMLKYNNIREMLSSLYIGKMRSTVWVPMICDVIPTISSSEEINPLSEYNVGFYANISKETLARSLKGIMTTEIAGENYMGQYIHPNHIIYPREFSIMMAQLRKYYHDNEHMAKWCNYYKNSKEEVAPMIANRYVGQECGICWEKMTDVKMLNCGHAYCEECYKKIDKCAICRVSIRKK